MAEGIDFADDMARTVCVMGIPFPNLYDARVKTKKEFLDARNEPGGLKGADWYRPEAFRAVNQVSFRHFCFVFELGRLLSNVSTL